ncbi:MAG: TIR domain-containing protein [Candidatus Thiodiazotropha taylori]
MPDPISVFIATSKIARRYGDATKDALRSINVKAIHWDDIHSFQRTDTVFDQLYSYSRGGNSFEAPDAAICILTADDKTNENGNDELKLTARHNVIFEAGLFIGAFGRNRVLLLVQDGVNLPSDLQGVVYDIIPTESNGQKWEDFIKNGFPTSKIQHWVCELPPSGGTDDDLRRIQRRMTETCKSHGLSFILQHHCCVVGDRDVPKPEFVEEILRDNQFIKEIADEDRKTVQSHITVRRNVEVDLYNAADVKYRDVLDSMKSWLAALIRATVCGLQKPPTKVAILGEPSLRQCIGNHLHGGKNTQRNNFKSRGVRLLEYAVDSLGYPIVYIDDSEFESGNDSNSDPVVIGQVSSNDRILIVHDVALTGRKFVRCRSALQNRGATVEGACLIVACQSEDNKGKRFCVREYLAEEKIAVKSLLELNVSVEGCREVKA